ncbi:MAG: hypothetical protein MJY71_00825 [Bacteroidaceae bacterium]|nr:hypothetical protein [Bacteroidaceae bacterium]
MNRDRKLTVLLNEKESGLIEEYLKKYKISNRSKWIRETLILFIMQKLEQDYPTLFSENEMRR